MIDQAFLFYVATSVAAPYGFVLFAWWWWKLGKASYMFRYLTFLFLGEGLRHAIDAHVRYHRVMGDMAEYLAHHDSWLWSARLYIPFLVVACIVGHISYRAFILRHRIIRTEEEGNAENSKT